MSVRRQTRRSRRTGRLIEYWIVDVDLLFPDGHRQRLRKVSPIPTRRGAEEYERQLREALLMDRYRAGREVKQAPTLERFVEDRWLPTYPASAGNRPRTQKEKELHIRLYIKPELGSRRLDQIRGEVLDRFFASMRSRKSRRGKLSDKTIKNVAGTLHKILVSAVEWGELEAVPKFPKIKTVDLGFDFLDATEAEKLVQAARDPEEKALLLFALRTGARAGEQLALEWGDIDWNSHLVLLRRSSSHGEVGATKSGKGRAVPMTAALEAALKAMRHLRGKRVFCRPDGKPLSIWQLHERLWGACRRAGLRKIRWHDLRHSFASQCVSAGVPVRQVQDWLGHSTIMMTMRYSHLAPGAGADLIAVLDRQRPTDGNEVAVST